MSNHILSSPNCNTTQPVRTDHNPQQIFPPPILHTPSLPPWSSWHIYWTNNVRKIGWSCQSHMWSKFLPHYAHRCSFPKHTWSSTMRFGWRVEETILAYFHQSPIPLVWREKPPIWTIWRSLHFECLQGKQFGHFIFSFDILYGLVCVVP